MSYSIQTPPSHCWKWLTVADITGLESVKDVFAPGPTDNAWTAYIPSRRGRRLNIAVTSLDWDICGPWPWNSLAEQPHSLTQLLHLICTHYSYTTNGTPSIPFFHSYSGGRLFRSDTLEQKTYCCLWQCGKEVCFIASKLYRAYAEGSALESGHHYVNFTVSKARK